MRNPNPIAEDNIKKYGKPPTWEQIESLVNEVGLSFYKFELFYSLPVNHLANVKTGKRQLCKSYWHLFYERIIPKYGVSFIREKSIPKAISKRILNSHLVPKRTKKVTYTSDNDTHDRTGNLK